MAASKSREKPKPQGNNAVDSSLSLIYSLMGLQLLTRVVTFTLNQVLVRLSTPQIYGTVSIQLELLLNTILFLSREGFRNALLRANRDSKTPTQLIANLATLPIYLGIPVSTAASALYLHYASGDTSSQPHFTAAVFVYTFAAMIELLSEPLFIRDVQSYGSSARLKAESLAVIAKAVVTTAVLSSNTANFGLIAFATGQLSYSCTLLLVYLLKHGSSTNFIMRKVPSKNAKGVSSGYFDGHLLNVSVAMTGQSVFKHILTEGDKFIVSRFSSLRDQGGFAVANNYGSLVARVFLQPVEESSRIFFSQALGTGDKHMVQKAYERLSSILLLYFHFIVVLVSLGPSYVPIILAILLPQKYLNTSAPAILSAWVWYIPVLAVNGIMEAFVSSAATPTDLVDQTKWMTASSVVYIASTVALFSSGRFGDSAVIYANMVNLSVRIVYGVRFIARFGEKYGYSFGSIVPVPPRSAVSVLVLTAGITRASLKSLDMDELLRLSKIELLLSTTLWAHLSLGIAGLLTFLVVCYITEKDKVLGFLSAFFSGRKSKSE